MADLSALSDDQLQAIIAGGGAAPALGAGSATQGAPPAAQPDLSGMSEAQLHSIIAAETPQMTGAAREIALPASNVAKGGMSVLGLPGDALNAAGQIYDKALQAPFTAALNWATGNKSVMPPLFSGANPIDSAHLLKGTNGLGITDRPDLTPQTTREQYEAAGAQGVGAALPAIATGGVSGMARLAALLTRGGTAGLGAQGGADLGGNVVGPVIDKTFGTNVTPLARTVGAVGGGLIGGGGFGAGATKPAIDPGTAALAKLATDTYGIPIVGAQLSESPATRILYSQLKKVPLSGVNEATAGQQPAFNNAVAGTFGETADKITPDVLQAGRSRISTSYNDIASRTTVPMTNDLMTNLQGVVDNARLTMSADSVAPVEKQAMNIVNTAANNGGSIGGKAFKDLTAQGGPLDTLANSSDSGLRQAGIQLRSVLHDALTASAAPEDVAQLQQNNAQWHAMKTVEPLTVRADTAGGPAPSTGDISPAALRGAVNQSYGITRTALAPLGAIPLNDLAKIGQRFLKEPADSNTATREMVTHGLAGLGGVAGAAAAGDHFGVPMAATLGGAAATMAAGRAAGSVLTSDWYSRMLLNAALRPRIPNPLAPAIAPLGALPVVQGTLPQARR